MKRRWSRAELLAADLSKPISEEELAAAEAARQLRLGTMTIEERNRWADFLEMLAARLV